MKILEVCWLIAAMSSSLYFFMMNERWLAELWLLSNMLFIAPTHYLFKHHKK